MWYWPKLQLTDHEKQFVGIYKEVDDKGKTVRPGVLRRSYRLQLANQAQPTKNIPAVRLTDQIQISRRSRVFAITFSGNTDAFRLSVRNTNGTQYTNPAPRSQGYPVVSSLVAGSYYNALATGGKPIPLAYNHASNLTSSIGPNPGFSNQFMSGQQSFPWIIEPNWVCAPNETLIFSVTDISPNWAFQLPPAAPTPPGVVLPAVLNIVIYAWEFPGMGV